MGLWVQCSLIGHHNGCKYRGIKMDPGHQQPPCWLNYDNSDTWVMNRVSTDIALQPFPPPPPPPLLKIGNKDYKKRLRQPMPHNTPHKTGIILCMHPPANERQCYNVTSFLIGEADTKNDHCITIASLSLAGLSSHSNNTLFSQRQLY